MRNNLMVPTLRFHDTKITPRFDLVYLLSPLRSSVRHMCPIPLRCIDTSTCICVGLQGNNMKCINNLSLSSESWHCFLIASYFSLLTVTHSSRQPAQQLLTCTLSSSIREPKWARNCRPRGLETRLGLRNSKFADSVRKQALPLLLIIAIHRKPNLALLPPVSSSLPSAFIPGH